MKRPRRVPVRPSLFKPPYWFAIRLRCKLATFTISQLSNTRSSLRSREKGNALCQQILDLYRQLPHADAGGVVNRISDCGGEAGQADLADAPRADLVNLVIGEVEEMDLDRGHVGVHRHHVVCQIAVDRRAALRGVDRVLQQ